MKNSLTFATVCLTAFLAVLGFLPGEDVQQNPVSPSLTAKTSAKTATTERKWVSRPHFPNGGHFAYFVSRDRMKKGHSDTGKKRVLAPKRVDPTSLPVDCTGHGTVVCPMNNNSTYGDCGLAMVTHADNILTFGQGKAPWTQSTFNVDAIVTQYLAISGGDNGMDESMLVGPGGVWITGLAGASGSWPATAPNARPAVIDSLDIDVTNVALAQHCIDFYYTLELAWSVPDSFIHNFTPGATYDAPVTPDPGNGHFTPLTDVDAGGKYRLYTWGAWCWVTPAFVAQVQPGTFVAFSTRQFNPATGYDSHGRHITTVAADWVALGGKTIPPAVIAAFPPAVGPTPPPTPSPTPTPPTATTITLSASLPAGTYEILPSGTAAAINDVTAAVEKLQQLQNGRPAAK